LAEVETLSHRVVTLRDGQNAGELSGSAINYKNMVEQMIGRELTHFYSRTPNATEQVLLSVEGLCTPANPHHPLQFHLRAGEIVGIAGLVGAGRTELLTTLFGVTPALAGNIQVAGTSVTLPDPQSAIAHGIALVPENRKQEGVILNMSVATNTSLPSLNRLTRWGLVHEGDEAKLALEMKSRLKTKTPHLSQPVKFLSGGNQQKVVIGKWLARGMKILLMDEPTRGVDVGARQEIYRLMDELAQTGVAILFVSSDLEEVLGMSDRMLVMHEGRIAGELSKERFSEQAVMNLATGNSALATAS
jgi:ribose transport system ATP-binding protein